MKYQILQGDCRETLATMPDESVNCVVTSPPYFGLRDYGTAQWEGGSNECDHSQDIKSRGSKSTLKNDGRPVEQVGWNTADYGAHTSYYKHVCRKCGARRIDQQIGLEQTPDEYVAQMVSVFREVRRVLRSDGTLWLNLGDSYAGSNMTGGNNGINASGGENGFKMQRQFKRSQYLGNLKSKDLIGIPWRVAFALQADGWWLRQDIIWAKPNPMPESVKDRCTKAHEYIFLLSKSAKYWYDADAVMEPVTKSTLERLSQPTIALQKGSARVPGKTNGNMKAVGTIDTRNRRSVWTVSTKPYSEAHFATFPPDLIEPCILAGCPEGGTVLDPFGGSGATAMVALKHRRNAILCELNPEYIELIHKRCAKVQPLLMTA